MTIYVDGSVKNHGLDKENVTEVVAVSEDNEVLLEKRIDNCSSVEAELTAITIALKEISPAESKELYSDCQEAVCLILFTKPRKNGGIATNKGLLKKRMTDLVLEAQTLLGLSGSQLKWLPRNQNKAGFYFIKKLNTKPALKGSQVSSSKENIN